MKICFQKKKKQKKSELLKCIIFVNTVITISMYYFYLIFININDIIVYIHMKLINVK